MAGKPEPKAALASEAKWKALYKKVFLAQETYSDFDNPSGQADLINLDQNGISELYLSIGVMPNLELCAIYDAARGELEYNDAPNVWFDNSVYKNRTTGAYVLSNENGRNAGYTTFSLLPIARGQGIISYCQSI